jgi:hypothetical protein
MVLQLGALRAALIDAGAAPEKADRAAEELAALFAFSHGDQQLARIRGGIGLAMVRPSVRAGHHRCRLEHVRPPRAP